MQMSSDSAEVAIWEKKETERKTKTKIMSSGHKLVWEMMLNGICEDY